MDRRHRPLRAAVGKWRWERRCRHPSARTPLSRSSGKSPLLPPTRTVRTSVALMTLAIAAASRDVSMVLTVSIGTALTQAIEFLHSLTAALDFSDRRCPSFRRRGLRGRGHANGSARGSARCSHVGFPFSTPKQLTGDECLLTCIRYEVKVPPFLTPQQPLQSDSLVSTIATKATAAHALRYRTSDRL